MIQYFRGFQNILFPISNIEAVVINVLLYEFFMRVNTYFHAREKHMRVFLDKRIVVVSLFRLTTFGLIYKIG